MVDRAIVDRLLGLLGEYVRDLESVRRLSFQDYGSDVRTRRFAERTLQIAIEACLDLGHHIIADEGFREPRDNRDVFKVLAEQRIVDEVLLPDLMNMASFRNLIVHAYGTVDNTVVFGLIQKKLDDFVKFSAMITRYLNR